MCDSLEESDGRITADYQVEPKCIVGIRRKKKVLLWRRCLNSKTAVDVREEQPVTAAEDGGAEDKSSVRSLQKTA